MCISSLLEKFILRWVGVLFILWSMSFSLWAQSERENHPILIISSYNPETYQTSQNISQFIDEYKLLGGKSPVMIENMNCKSFSESYLWKTRMSTILMKYTGEKSPALILLLGQEAWSAYISLDQERDPELPLLCGMVSQNAIVLPEDTVNLAEWKPESIDVLTDYQYNSHISGFVYKYDVEKNIRLILELYPDTRHIAFISDNSYGGVSLQAYVKKEMEKFPELDLILLDGRKNTIYTLVDHISTLPLHTVILVGTWRVDRNDGYFMRNATYSMMSANPGIPAFTLTSVGMGHWTIGGYQPQYRSVGKELAEQAFELIHGNVAQEGELNSIPNEYCFDYNKLKEFGLTSVSLPETAFIINQEEHFFDKYRYHIYAVGTAFLILLIGFVTTLYYYWRTKRLKDELQISEVELRAAKERAEESDRLKSAFLANMSHEIRTPLNAIVGFSNVLVAGDCTLEEQQEYVEVIQTNSDLLLRLINDILDISRLETGRLKFAYEKCDVIDLCQKILSTTSYTKKTRVEYSLKTSFQHYELETDVQRLQQILINLLSNANKFTEKGEITLEVQEDAAKEYLIFSVTDTGCGIPPEKREKVFERFEKLDEYVQGTGLGLAICRLTIHVLGGKIWVDPDYNLGARFVFTHPLRRTIVPEGSV